MEPLTKVFSPNDAMYSDVATAETLLNLARQQGFQEWADTQEMKMRHIRKNVNPNNARQAYEQLAKTFEEIDGFSKEYIQPQLGKSQEANYRLLSDEEAIRMGLPEGQKYQVDGRGQVKTIPTSGGMETITEVGPDGRTTIRQITGRMAGKKQVDPMVEDKEKDRAVAETESFLTQLNMLDNFFKELPQEENVAGGVSRFLQSKVIGTPAYDATKTFEALQGMARVEKMQQLRMASPTGSTGMGQLSNAEGEALAKAFLGSLDINTRPTTFRKNLLSAQTKLLDEIHGSRRLREKWLKEGKITPEQNAEVEAQYPDVVIDIKGNLVPRPKPQMPQQPAQQGMRPATPSQADFKNMSDEDIMNLLQGQR